MLVVVDPMTGRQSDIDLKNSLDYLQLSLQEIQVNEFNCGTLLSKY